MIQPNIPLLSADHIEELRDMVAGIIEENKKTFEECVHQQQDIANATIISIQRFYPALYSLALQQWQNKQAIVDNLCHFTFTMMSTVQVLWEQKQHLQDQVNNLKAYANNLETDIQNLEHQYEVSKQKLNENQTRIDELSEEKQKIQEFYRSQSQNNLLDFQHQTHELLELNSLRIDKEEATQSKSNISLNLQKMEQKQQEIQILKQSKEDLEKRFEALVEENGLIKMQIELAEIAVQDALSFKSASLLGREDEMPNNAMVTPANSTKMKYLSGELDCFSNPNQSIIDETRNLLAHQIDDFQMELTHYPSSPCLLYDSQSTLIQQPLNANNSLIFKSPFTKKIHSQIHIQNSQIEASQISKINVISSLKEISSKKTVALQCNLLKQVPKIEFFKKLKQIDKKQVIKIKGNLVNKQIGNILKERSKEKVEIKKVKESKNMKKNESEGSFSKLLSYLSAKVVTQRIKVK